MKTYWKRSLKFSTNNSKPWLRRKNNWPPLLLSRNLKFSGDPTKYKTFIIAFDARIQTRAANDADRLYYLDQHLTGKPKDLIGGCLYLEPDMGYREVRKLLHEEYGDPYKISNAFIQRLSNWPVIKCDDSPSLKRFSLFLTCLLYTSPSPRDA